MTNKDAVKWLGNLRNDLGNPHYECLWPYAQAIDEICELLEEQEPRVMTLEEVQQHYSLPPIFPDDFGMQEDYYNDIAPLYFEFQRDDPYIVHWRGYNQGVAICLSEWKENYGKTWRCWTARPTKEQREAEPWES